MKKFFLPFFALLMVSGLSAQQGDMLNHKGDIPEKIQQFDMNQNAKLNQSSDWFNYMREIMNIATAMPYYRNYLFPDSTVMAEFSNGISSVWKHSVGQVLDPTSNYFLFDATKISKAANYTLDSIALPYRYYRYQTGKPDTLVIQIFKQNQLTLNSWPSGWSLPRSYAYPPYDPVARKGASPFKEIVRILDIDDTAVFAQRFIEEEINVSVAPDEIIAVTFTYFPGNPFNVGDTIDPLMIPAPGNKINCFTFFDSRDDTKILDSGFYNHGLNASTVVRYNLSTNGWNGKYIVGPAWNTGTHHIDLYNRLTFDDYRGIADLKEQNVLSVYPNPAATDLTVEYRVKGADQAVLEFTNMLGSKVKTEILDTRLNKAVINVSDLENGVYFYSLKLDGKIIGTSRLVMAK
jgi:hypothetical protein